MRATRGIRIPKGWLWLAAALWVLLLVGASAGQQAETLLTDLAGVPSNTFTTAACFPGNTDLLSPTAQAADNGGDNDGFEMNPTNAFADDAVFASNIDGDGDRHRYYDYGMAIQADCSIQGIEARLDWWLDDTNGISDMRAELSWDGGTSWTAAKIDTQETTTEHTVSLGGSTDTWGRTWTPGEFSNANLRVRLTTRCAGTPADCGARDYFVDWVAVKVYYGP